MSKWTVVCVVRTGVLDILGIIEGEFIARPTTVEGEPEIYTHIIDADSRQDAERQVRERYFPVYEGVGEEPTC